MIQTIGSVDASSPVFFILCHLTSLCYDLIRGCQGYGPCDWFPFVSFSRWQESYLIRPNFEIWNMRACDCKQTVIINPKQVSCQ